MDITNIEVDVKSLIVNMTGIVVDLNPCPAKCDCRSFLLRAVTTADHNPRSFWGFPHLAYKYTLIISCNTKQ